jgi:hypothetical protein
MPAFSIMTARDSVVPGFEYPERHVSLACLALVGVARYASSALSATGSQMAPPECGRTTTPDGSAAGQLWLLISSSRD